MLRDPHSLWALDVSPVPVGVRRRSWCISWDPGGCCHPFEERKDRLADGLWLAPGLVVSRTRAGHKQSTP